jgi:hypothetical protein
MTKAERIKRAEIEKRVYEKFPISKAEMKCSVERGIMNQLRYNFRKKLMEEEKEKKEY